MLFKRTLPLLVVFVLGIAMMIQYFIPHPISQSFKEGADNWIRIIGAFAIVLGLASFFHVHTRKIMRKNKDSIFSVVAIVSLIGMALIGILGKDGLDNWLFSNLYSYIIVPLDATMFSLLSFYIASAAFKAFKARNAMAFALLVTAIIVMLGRVSFGSFLNGLVEWIMVYPNTAAQRGILIGIGLGIIATSLKIILGIERSYLGGE
ncbi:MAG: hypothetical protein APR63_01450 [Desulfuromonas sp. SDB]|nr:MAG: hypothetical protein APR63_01450 [Desulfuromonas sp. SDB]